VNTIYCNLKKNHLKLTGGGGTQKKIRTKKLPRGNQRGTVEFEIKNQRGMSYSSKEAEDEGVKVHKKKAGGGKNGGPLAGDCPQGWFFI